MNIMSKSLCVWMVVLNSANGGTEQPQQDAGKEGVVKLTGTLHVIWGDPVGNSAISPHHRIKLVDHENRFWTLQVAEDALRRAGGLMRLERKQVIVEGRTTKARLQSLEVQSIRLENETDQDASVSRISGSQPYIWLFFKFADNPNPVAQSFDWFEEQALGQYGMDPFYRELSYQTVDMAGSAVFRQWFTLPRIPADYGIIGDTDNGDVNLDLMLWDVLNLTIPVVDFRPYEGMILVFNGPLDCCAWGGRPSLALSGEPSRPFGVVWIGDGGFQGHDVVTHELGHAFGLPHSSGCGVEYNSIWDLMGLSCGTCSLPDPRTGTPHGVHAIAYHKDRLGWIHPLHGFSLPYQQPAAARVQLHDLVRVPPTGQYLWARLMLSVTAPTFYSIERRCLTGYDANLPDAVVAIHHVDELRSIPADMPDVDGGACNDEGSMWRPGESLYDSANNILIGVEWANADSSGVTLTNQPRNPAFVSWSNIGCRDGSAGCPWTTISDGHASVLPGGQVYAIPGDYQETIILGKPATLVPWGSGSVTIGR